MNAPRTTLDAVDTVIVAELVRDGRATLAHLAERAGLSVSAVPARVRRLEASGVVLGYTARVDHEVLGTPLTAFVAITPLDPTAPDDAPARLRELDGVRACHSVAGEDSYVLLVRVGSPRDLEHLLQRIRTTAGVNTRSTIVLQTFYDE